MPAKNAAPAAPKDAKGKPADNKPPQNAQGRGQQKQAQAPPAQAQAPAPAQSSQQKRERPYATDPEKSAIQHKLDDIDTSMGKHKVELENLKKAIDAEKKVRDDLAAKQTKIREALKQDDQGKKMQDTFSKQNADIAEIRRLQKIKIENSIQMRVKLPNAPPAETVKEKDADGKEYQRDLKPEDILVARESYLRKLDDDIRLLERDLSSSAVSLQAEKKKVDQISQLQKAKKNYKEYTNMRDLIMADSKAITDILAARDKHREEREASKGKRDVEYAKIDELQTKVQASWEKHRGFKAKEDEIRDANKKLWDEKQALKNKLIEVNTKIQEKRIAEQKAKEDRYNEEKQRKAAYRAERAKKEALETPYEDEMDLCKTLVQYLESLRPKAQEEEVTAPTKPDLGADVTILSKDNESPEPAKSKGKNKNKNRKVPQELKHNVNVFKQFETLSLAPPAKLTDIDTSVSELNAKQEHYSKLSAATVAARKEAIAKDEASSSSESAAPASTETTSQ